MDEKLINELGRLKKLDTSRDATTKILLGIVKKIAREPILTHKDYINYILQLFPSYYTGQDLKSQIKEFKVAGENFTSAEDVINSEELPETIIHPSQGYARHHTDGEVKFHYLTGKKMPITDSKTGIKRNKMVPLVVFSNKSIHTFSELEEKAIHYDRETLRPEINLNPSKNYFMPWEAVREFLNSNRIINTFDIFAEHFDILTDHVKFPNYYEPYISTTVQLGSYVWSLFPFWPYLWVKGLKESGKTQYLILLSNLVFNPKMDSSISPAALVLEIHNSKCTILWDEGERFLDESSAEVNAILCSGNKEGTGGYTRRFGEAADLKSIDFKVNSLKVFASINDLPSTLADRAIPIYLDRCYAVKEFIKTDKVINRLNRLRIDSYIWGLQNADLIRSTIIKLLANRKKYKMGHIKGRSLEKWLMVYVIGYLSRVKGILDILQEASKKIIQKTYEYHQTRDWSTKILKYFYEALNDCTNYGNDEQRIYFVDEVMEAFNARSDTKIQKSNTLTRGLNEYHKGVLSINDKGSSVRKEKPVWETDKDGHVIERMRKCSCYLVNWEYLEKRYNMYIKPTGGEDEIVTTVVKDKLVRENQIKGEQNEKIS